MCDTTQAQNDRVIAALARRNAELEEKVRHLEDAAQKRRHWLDEAKIAAGFSINVSFDEVWAECLAAYNRQKTGG